MKNKTCGDCRWGMFNEDREYGVCTAPAPGWAEHAEPTVSIVGDGADYARTCPIYCPIGGVLIEKGGENE